MERKIGEIFEYKGKWYQCVVAIQGCRECSFRTHDYCTHHLECLLNTRSDRTSVIFKKLEKVGEPYMAHDHSRDKDVVVQDYKLYNQHACYNGHEETLCFGLYGKDGMVTIKSKEPIKSLNCENSVEIQIKQNKKDMEEKKSTWRKEDTPLTRLVGKYVNNLIDYDTFEKCVKEWCEKYSNPKNIGKNLKPFDLQAAKSGKPVCTRDGRKARIICFDSKNDPQRPIIALVENNSNELLYEYTIKGKELFSHISTTGTSDLMMLPEKKEGWVNVYKGGLLDTKSYPTKKEAFENASPKDYVDTIKINWSE